MPEEYALSYTADPSSAPMCSSGDWSIARVRSSRIALMSAWPKVKPPGCPAPASCANWRQNTPQSTIPSCMLLRHNPKALRPGSSLDITNTIGHAKRAANQSSAQGRQSSCRSSAQGRQVAEAASMKKWCCRRAKKRLKETAFHTRDMWVYAGRRVPLYRSCACSSRA